MKNSCFLVQLLAMTTLLIISSSTQAQNISAHKLQEEELGPRLTELSETGEKVDYPSGTGRMRSAKTHISDDFIIFGYIQSEFMISAIRWHALTHVGTTFVDFTSNGSLQNPSSFTNRHSDLKAGGAADNAGVKVILIIRNDNFSESVLSSVMQSSTNRTALVNNVINLLNSDAYVQGVSFDFEFSWGSSTRNGISLFLDEMRTALEAQAKDYEMSLYTHAIYDPNKWHIPTIAPLIDYMLYSTYDWATGSAHAIADFNSYDGQLSNYFSAGLPPEKMVITLPVYARQWRGASGYNQGGTRRSQGFPDGLYDTTLNPNDGGPQSSIYVVGDEVEYYTWSDGFDNYTATWDNPASSYHIKLGQALSFYNAGNSSDPYNGRRLGGIGYWSLMWMVGSAYEIVVSGQNTSYALSGGGAINRFRTYPQLYQLTEEMFSSPGQQWFLVTGFEGSDPLWEDPNVSPETSGDTNGDSSVAFVTSPGGSGAPESSTTAAQVTFDFEGSGSNRLFFRQKPLASYFAPSVLDTNAMAALFDSSTKLQSHIYTPSSYGGYDVRMVVMDSERELLMSPAFTLNATGWRTIEMDLTAPFEVNDFGETAEPGFVNGDGVLTTAGGGARDIAFVGFLVEGEGAISGSLVVDEISYANAFPAGPYTINEFRYTGNTGEFVEIYGPAGSLPAGMELRLMYGSRTIPAYSIGGVSIPDDGGGFGYLVVGDSGVPNLDFSGNFSIGLNDLHDADPSGIQLRDSVTGVVYDSVVYEAYGGLDELVRAENAGVAWEGYPWLGEAATGSDAAGNVYTMGRHTDGFDTDINHADFTYMVASPGASNAGNINVGFSSDFSTPPAGAFQTYQQFSVSDPTGSGLPSSPDGGNAHRSVDTTGGGVLSVFGNGGFGSGTGYSAKGYLYIPSNSDPAQAIGIGIAGSQGSNFFEDTPHDTGYENGYWLIYENAAGVDLNDGRSNHPGVFEFVEATNDNMDGDAVELLGSANLASVNASEGSWAEFYLSLNPNASTGEQLIALINGEVIFVGDIPEGGRKSGAFQVGFRENHSGAPAAVEGTWIDGLSIASPYDPAKISSQPEDLIVSLGEPASFSVAAEGLYTTYQWQKFDGESWIDILDATSSTYNISPAMLNDAGDYRVVVSDPLNSIISSVAKLTVESNLYLHGWMILESGS